MGNIVWTKSWSASDNGTVLGGADLQNIQNDITTVVNGGITNSNIDAAAAIVESKIAFSTTGHTHNGSDAAYPLIKHYRKGCYVKSGTTATTDVKVTPGVVDIGGKLLISTADINTDISNATNFADGGVEPADGPVYVYGYDNSGSLGIKLSTEPPDLSDSSDNTAEFPLRYQLYSAVYYRLLGILHNRTDILLDMFCQFDLSNFATGSFAADGADETVKTGWTPDYIETHQCSDATPAAGEAFQNARVQRYGFATANPQPQNLNYRENIATHQHIGLTTSGTVNAITVQTTSAAGGFVIDAPTSGEVVMWTAWAMGMRG